MCQVSESDFTMSGHLVGMLDRDQRTAKVPTYLKCVQSTNNNYTEKHHHRTKYLSHRSRKIFLWKTLQRLKQVLVVGTYLLSIVSIPSSISAPASIANMGDSRTSDGKWVNPCSNATPAYDELDNSEPPESESALIDKIVFQAKLALGKAKQFKEDYAQAIHGSSSSDDLNNIYKPYNYNWLPNKTTVIPKTLGEVLPEDSEHLKSLTFNEFVVDIYKELQKIAVGLEAIVWDQEEDGQFGTNFTETEDYLRAVLCEIQMAIIERSLKQEKDVERSIMEDNIRHPASTHDKNIRDWLIYRDYMNALEYIIQAFTYIKNHPSP